MSLKIATVERQRSLVTLARSLFNIRHEPELQKRAEQALLQANPQLVQGARIATGDIIVVPEVRGLAPTDIVRRTSLTGAPLEGVAAQRLARLLKSVQRIASV